MSASLKAQESVKAHKGQLEVENLRVEYLLTVCKREVLTKIANLATSGINEASLSIDIYGVAYFHGLVVELFPNSSSAPVIVGSNVPRRVAKGLEEFLRSPENGFNTRLVENTNDLGNLYSVNLFVQWV
jgi:hypothetical protein